MTNLIFTDIVSEIIKKSSEKYNSLALYDDGNIVFNPSNVKVKLDANSIIKNLFVIFNDSYLFDIAEELQVLQDNSKVEEEINKITPKYIKSVKEKLNSIFIDKKSLTFDNFVTIFFNNTASYPNIMHYDMNIMYIYTISVRIKHLENKNKFSLDLVYAFNNISSLMSTTRDMKIKKVYIYVEICILAIMEDIMQDIDTMRKHMEAKKKNITEEYYKKCEEYLRKIILKLKYDKISDDMDTPNYLEDLWRNIILMIEKIIDNNKNIPIGNQITKMNEIYNKFSKNGPTQEITQEMTDFINKNKDDILINNRDFFRRLQYIIRANKQSSSNLHILDKAHYEKNNKAILLYEYDLYANSNSEKLYESKISKLDEITNISK